MKATRLTRRGFLQATGAASALAALPLRGLAETKPPADAINLLFIMTDQQRFDALGRAGNTVLETPHLDSLARDGVYFANAYSSCPICVPARAVILTGRTITSVGVLGNNHCEPTDGADVPTFDNVLARNGYHTEYYGKWHTPFKYASTYKNPVRQTGKHSRNAAVPGQAAAYKAYVAKHVKPRELRKGELLDKGSGRPYKPDALDWRFGVDLAEFEQRLREAKRAARKAGKDPRKVKLKGPNLTSQAGSYGCLDVPPAHTRTAFVAGEVIAALDRVKDKPFSLTCSFGPPHPPMVLAKPFYGMYPAKDIEAPASIDDPMINSPYAARAAQAEMKRYRNKGHARQMTSNYYGMVAEIDHWVGKILARLKTLGLDKRTLVIFTSDHGEMLGDHGLHSKMILLEGSAHIPLLMRLPGAIDGGTVVATPVSHVDLFATILDYLKMPAHACDGRSLRKLVKGARGEGPDYCVSQWGGASGPTMMVRTKDWKYITSHNPKSKALDALYDLQSDPHEMNNLIGKNPRKADYVKQAREMKARLVEWLTRTRSPRLAGVRARKI